MKNKEDVAEKNRFRTVASPGACGRLAVLNWRSSSIHASSSQCRQEHGTSRNINNILHSSWINVLTSGDQFWLEVIAILTIVMCYYY